MDAEGMAGLGVGLAVMGIGVAIMKGVMGGTKKVAKTTAKGGASLFNGFSKASSKGTDFFK